MVFESLPCRSPVSRQRRSQVLSRSIEPWERGWCHACVWPGSIKRRLLKKVLDNLGPRHEGYGVAVMMSQTY